MTIHTGDCVEVMRTFPSESIDAIVTDPPAGIAFMSRHWDRDKGGRTEWVAWMTEVMRECYRVLKPGGYAVVWSLPRTCHWTAWAMEDAGFIIRDQLAHIFASGFPKGKAQLKPAREDWWLARKPGPLQPLQIDATRIPSGEELIATHHGTGHGGPAAYISTGSEPYQPGDQRLEVTAGRWPSNVLLSDPELFDEPNPEVVGSGATQQSPGTYQRSVTDWPPGSVPPLQSMNGREVALGYGDSGGYSRFFGLSGCQHPNDRRFETEDGGWSCLCGHEDGPGYPTAFLIPKSSRADREPVVRGQVEANSENFMAGLPDPRMDRPQVRNARENAHPTVKPTDLMRHLVRLVTPSGGTVLDPFLGSGSTAIACELEGFPWLGIEQDASYVAIAEARLNGTQRGLGLDVPAPTKAPPKTHPDLSKHQPKRRAPAENYTGGWAGTEDDVA